MARWRSPLKQVEELGRIRRLKRFLAPRLAELIVSQGEEKILESHRRDIVVVFCDLRGYIAFTVEARLDRPHRVPDDGGITAGLTRMSCGRGRLTAR